MYARTDATQGDLVDVRVTYADRWMASPGAYQGLLRLCLMNASQPVPDAAWPTTENQAALTANVHSSIQHTWMTLETPGERVSGGITTRLEGGSLRFLVRNGRVAAYFWNPRIDDWQQVSKDDLPVPASPFRVGLLMLPNWQANARVYVSRFSVLVDREADGLYDDEEEFVGGNTTDPDTDGDGVPDRLDARPADPQSSASFRPALACGEGVGDDVFVRYHAGAAPHSGLLVILENQIAAPRMCNITLPGSVPWAAGVALGAKERKALRVTGRDLAPFGVPSVPVIKYDLTTGAQFDLDLRNFVWDDVTPTAALSLSSCPGTPTGEVDVAFPGGGIVRFTSPDRCSVLDACIRAGDSMSQHVDLRLAVYFLNGRSGNLFQNADFETTLETAPKSWHSFTWEGIYELSETAVVVSPGGSTRALQIEGLQQGKFGVYQSVALGTGTYQVEADVAAFEVVPGQYGSTANLLVLPGSDQMIQQPIVAGGSTDWKHVSLQFTLTKPQEVTIYFRLFGTGHLWVDNARLSELMCHPPVVPPFYEERDLAHPLVFDPPFDAAVDGVLCGYCAADQFSLNRTLCARCSHAGYRDPASDPAKEPSVLASFSAGTLQPFYPSSSWSAVDVGGGEHAAQLLPGKYMASDGGRGLPRDWRGFDFLRVDVHNPRTTAVKFYIEVRDIESAGYWSRVNWYTSAAPGHTTITMPLRVYVGEKTVIQERRFLRLDAITRLVYQHAAGGAVGGEAGWLRLDNVRLEAEAPFSAAFPELVRLDLGPVLGPVAWGFTPVRPADYYRTRRGYGIVPGSEVARVEDRRHPTDLLRDWISFRSGGLAFDLPPGRYVVVVFMEDAGYWEYYQSYRWRSILAEGAEVVRQEMDWGRFAGRYFAHQETEDYPGQDTFAAYVRERYRPFTFSTSVTDGQLNLEFESPDTYGCTVSGVLLYPEAKQVQGDAFLAQLWQKMKAAFDIEYLQVPPELPPAPITAPASLSVFQRHPLLKVHSASRMSPEHGDTDLLQERGIVVVLQAGQSVDVSWSLRSSSRRSVRRVSVELGPDVRVGQLHVIRSKLKRVTESVFTATPLIVDPVQLPFTLRNGTATRFRVSVSLAGSPTAGCRRSGSVRMTFADGKHLAISVVLDILPFCLMPVADAGLIYGYLGTVPLIPSTRFPELEALRNNASLSSVTWLRTEGMSGFTGGLGGPRITGYATGKATMDFSQADATINLLFPDGPSPRSNPIPFGSYGGFDIGGIDLRRASTVFGQDYQTVVTALVSAYQAHSVASNWPTVYQHLADEPRGEEIQHNIDVAKIFRAGGTGPHSALRTSVYTSFTDAHDERVEFANWTDLLIMNHHSVEAIEAINARGAEWMLYNQDGRYWHGLYLLAVLPLGCRGYYQFMFSSPGADPYYALDAREDDLGVVFLAEDGGFRASTSHDELKTALDDLRYALTLREESRRAATSSNATIAAASIDAQAYLENLTSHMPVGREAGTQPPFSDHELDRIREEMGSWLRRLAGLQGVCAPGPPGNVTDPGATTVSPNPPVDTTGPGPSGGNEAGQLFIFRFSIPEDLGTSTSAALSRAVDGLADKLVEAGRGETTVRVEGGEGGATVMYIADHGVDRNNLHSLDDDTLKAWLLDNVDDVAARDGLEQHLAASVSTATEAEELVSTPQAAIIGGSVGGAAVLCLAVVATVLSRRAKRRVSSGQPSSPAGEHALDVAATSGLPSDQGRKLSSTSM